MGDSEEMNKGVVRRTEMVRKKSFNFNTLELINIHSRLFGGI